MPKILHPADIELACRRTLEAKIKQSAIAIRVAIQASKSHGLQWFPVTEVYKSLKGVSKNLANPGPIAIRLCQLGIAKHKLVSLPNYSRHDARLICDLVDINHFHGQKSEQLRGDIETYSEGHPRSSPLAALLLVGIHLYGIQRSIELAKFLKPEFNLSRSASTPGRILNELADSALLGIVRGRASQGCSFLVFPMDR